MPYVYILSDYEEHGAKNVCATLDRSKLVGMVSSGYLYQEPSDAELNQSPPTYDALRIATHKASRARRRANHDTWVADAIAGLEKLLGKPDAELVADRDGHYCGGGWGGLMLHVVELA